MSDIAGGGIMREGAQRTIKQTLKNVRISWQPRVTKRDYITRAGWQALADELGQLWREKRPRVVRALADAAAEGDRSENAEYIYRKKELREIDRRVRYLSRRVDTLTIVDRPPDDTSRVFFGARIELCDDTGQLHHYRIVGADETKAQAGHISLHSPVARALIGRSVGDCARVELPAGTVEYEICAVTYDSAAD